MKKLFVTLMVLVGVVAAPAASMAYSTTANGYWEPYTTTERVAYKVPQTRYVCDNRGYYDYWYGREYCYYTTDYVTKYKTKKVKKYRWVEYSYYQPVYSNSYYNDYGYYNNNTRSSYVRGYNDGYYDGSYNRAYDPYGYRF